MLRSEIFAWLEENGGQKNYQEKMVAVKGKDQYDKETTNYERHVIWTANNGKVLEVVDESQQNPGDSSGMRPGDRDDGQGGRDPDYRLISRGDPDNTDNRSPEQVAQQRAKHAEAEWNRANGPQPDPTSPAYDGSGRGSGIYETHTERASRERSEATEARQEEAAARAGRIEERQTATAARQAQTEAERLEIERGRAQTEKERAASTAENEKNRTQIERERLEAEKKGKTQVIGNPTDADQFISTYNPVTGEFGQTENPNYDPIKTAAAKKREEIRLGIEAGKFNLETGKAEYDRWYQQNVTTPIALSQERRAQAAEKRQAQEAADRREQARRQNELDRAKLGQQAAETASANVRAELPYMAGPEFGEQFSSAINGLAHGGTLDSNAASGINFSADAFEFNRPNWSKIARNATKEALKHLTPYDPDETPYAVADYSGINQPTSETMAGAPAPYVPPAALTSATQQAANSVGAGYPSTVPPFQP